MKAGRFVTGWARVEVRGERPERMLRALAERGIPFWDAEPPMEFALRLSLPARKAWYVPAFAAALGCEGEILSVHGFPSVWKKLCRRRALLLCLGLLLGLLALSRLFVWQVVTEGAEELPRGQVLAALDECGVSVGAFWPAFSQDLIRNAMLLELPELRWMTVNMQGCCARVILRSGYEGAEPLDEEEPAKILAVKAGVVLTVRALRGTAEVAPTEVVLPGELLIDGLATGRFEGHGAVRALGTVEAETWYELSAQLPLTEQEKSASGKKSSRWALILGKRRINFYKGCSICPADCAKMTMETSLSVPGLFFLPVRLLREDIYPFESTPGPACEPVVCAREQLMEELMARIGPQGRVLNSHESAAASEGVLTVTLRARCREEIGQTVPLTDAEIASKIPSTKEEDP